VFIRIHDSLVPWDGHRRRDRLAFELILDNVIFIEPVFLHDLIDLLLSDAFGLGLVSHIKLKWLGDCNSVLPFLP